MNAENLSVAGRVTNLNIMEWKESAVLKSSDQEISGSWTVAGPVELRSVVRGKGQLGNTNLTEQEQHVTQHILDAHTKMKVHSALSAPRRKQ